jgi:hypothetical protein
MTTGVRSTYVAWQILWILRLSVLYAAMLLFAPEISAGDEGDKKEAPKVTLQLLSATAEHVNGLDCVLVCQVVIENNTGGPLRVKSRFFSVFDGIAVVIIDEKGKKLAEQPYIFHQSPMADEREHTLPTGRSKDRLAFDLRDLPKAPDLLQVRLEGTLPGSGYEPTLRTEVVPVKRKTPAK